MRRSFFCVDSHACGNPVRVLVGGGPLLPNVSMAERVDVTYVMNGETVESIRLFNVNSYLHQADVQVEVPGVGTLTVDIAYGGNYYAVVEPQAAWAGLDGLAAADIVGLSQKLRAALAEVCNPVHPEDSRISGVHHVIWCDKPSSATAHGRCAVFYGDKAIDRSPGGTGTSARMAQLYGKGRLQVGDTFRHESPIGTIFEGKVESAVKVGAFDGIRPSVTGWAQVIGHNTIFVDDKDPLAHGFQLA